MIQHDATTREGSALEGKPVTGLKGLKGCPKALDGISLSVGWNFYGFLPAWMRKLSRTYAISADVAPPRTVFDYRLLGLNRHRSLLILYVRSYRPALGETTTIYAVVFHLRSRDK